MYYVLTYVSSLIYVCVCISFKVRVGRARGSALAFPGHRQVPLSTDRIP